MDLDQVLSELPGCDEKKIHVIPNNYCIHKQHEEWLARHPNVTFHVTPTSQFGSISSTYGLVFFLAKP
jgi:hypothetical protein